MALTGMNSNGWYDDWYETTGRGPRSPIGAVLQDRYPRHTQTAGALFETLDCGCERESSNGMSILHYSPVCWRHAPDPPYVIQEEP